MAEADDITGVPVQRINKLVMQTTDLVLLERWLAEEKDGARRLSALTRIYHRYSQVRREQELRELEETARARKG